MNVYRTRPGSRLYTESMVSMKISLIVLFTLGGGVKAGPDYKDNILRFVSDKPINIDDKRQYADCHELRYSGGYNVSGLYTLHLNKSFSYQIQCEHTPNNSFTVIQRRIDGRESFKRGFHEYVYGFGNPQSDYWAGLNQIYYLTNTAGNNILTINMQNWQGHLVTLRYNFFRVRDTLHYTLDIGGYQTSHILPDDLAFNNGMPFATFDKPDSYNCASSMHAGWWYNYCSYALPNGVYYFGGSYTPPGGYYDGIYYKDWMGYGYSLKFVTMTVSRK